MLTCRYVNSFICPHVNRTIPSIICKLELSYLTLFLCTQDFKANGVNCSFIRACVRACVRACLDAPKTCFHCFCSNSVNFYRIKLIFNVFWEPFENLKLWLHLCHSAMASCAIAGVFTYARITFLKALHPWIFIGSWLFKIISRTAQHN